MTAVIGVMTATPIGSQGHVIVTALLARF